MASIFDDDAPVTAPAAGGAAVPPAVPADVFAADAPVTPSGPDERGGGSWWRAPEVFAGGAARGLIGIPGIPGNLESLARAGLNYAGAGVSPRPAFLPTSGEMVGYVEQIPGVGPALAATEPRTRGERYLSRAGEFVGGTAPTLFLGGAPSLANVLGQSARAAGAGVGSELAGEAFPQHPIIAPLVGALAGQAGTGAAIGAGRRVGAAANLVPTASTPLTQAYEAAGVTPRLAGDVSERPTLQVAQRVASVLPGGGQVGRALEQTVDEFGNSLENTASQLAPAASKIETGQAVQKAGQDWLDAWKTRERGAWDRLNVPNDAPVDMSNVMSTLQGRLGTYPGAPKLAASQGNAELRQLYSDLQSDVGEDGTLQWQAAKNLRSDLGAKIGPGAWSPDRDLAALQSVYGGVSDAMRGAAADNNMIPELVNAQAVTREGHNFLDNGLRGIMNATPEGAVDQAMSGVKRGGGSTLTTLRQNMPDAADALGGYQLRQMALAPPSRQNAAGTAVSPNSYLTSRSALSDEAKAALFSDPDVAARLANLDQVAGSMGATWNRLPNPSGTGATVAHAVPWTTAATGAAGGFMHGGVPGALAGALSGVATVAPGMGLANVLARPAGTRFLMGPAERSRFNWPGYAVGGAVLPYLAQ